jgi:hypothetical protein
LDWDEVEQHHGTYADLHEATEYGACGIALIVATKLTGMSSVERSARGTGVDYWLGDGRTGSGVFQRAARLEVSGILNGNSAKIAVRLSDKLSQTSLSDQVGLPAYVAVVEFGTPEARLVKKVQR